MRSTLVLLLALWTLGGTAQTRQEADSMLQHKVMLIPFDPRYYLSDADRDLMEQSRMEPSRFRSEFRHNIDRSVKRAISGGYPCISLLNDTADALEETLYEVLGRTGYRYEKAIPITPKMSVEEKVITRTKDAMNKDHEDSKTASQYIPVKNDAMYMHAVVTKPQELFAKLNSEYEADYFVFLTQFEIKTNYKSCLDIANQIYRRELMVHFTIYDKTGKLVAGSYATSYFPSNSNDPYKIIGDCFPEIARYIAGCLP
jgi:hypothetical protein